MKLGKIFERPVGFSSRGDRQLMAWLKEEINPEFDIESREEFEAYILSLIKIKTKHDIMKETKMILRVEGLAEPGATGLSAGIINPLQWQLIIKRLSEQLEA